METSEILIVEDEIILAMSLQSMLEILGYKTIGIATSGEEAIEYASRKCPKLVIMDITLDGNIDGIEAATHIINRCGLPVIFLSGYSDDKTIDRANKTKHSGFLRKPIDEQQLIRAIKKALEQSSESIN